MIVLSLSDQLFDGSPTDKDIFIRCDGEQLIVLSNRCAGDVLAAVNSQMWSIRQR